MSTSDKLYDNEAIKEALDKSPLSITQIAAAAGVTTETVRAAMAGKNVTIQTLRGIAVALGLDPAEVVRAA